MNRAYSLITLKSVDEDKRILSGVATTPTPDRMGDIVEPKGAEFTLPIPLLWQHDASQPIGHVTKAKVTKDGIEVEVKLAKITEAGTLKDRIDEAWQSIKAGLVRGLSIGFKALEFSRLEDGGLRFLKWSWLELSAVTIPANSEASITSIKAADIRAEIAHDREVLTNERLLAASGRKAGVVRLTPPGASGLSKTTIPKEPKVKTFKEQIKEWEATRAAKVAKRDEILAKSAESGETPDDAQQTELDEIKDSVAKIDKHLGNLRDAEKDAAANIKAVDGGDQESASRSRESTPLHNVQVLGPKLEKGDAFGMYMICLAQGVKTNTSPLDVARQRFPEYVPLQRVLKHVGGMVDPSQLRYARELSRFEKGAVGAGTTSDTNWATALVEYTVLENEFVEYLSPRTIVGQFGTGNIPSLNRQPFNIKVPRQTSLPSADWVGEGKPKPVSKFALDSVTLDFHKIAVISVITDALQRFSRPGAERLVRDQLARAVIKKMDVDFIDPSKSASAGVSPASVLNSVTAISSATTTGTVAEVISDVQTILAEFNQENIDVGSMVWIMNRNVALALSLMQTSLGQSAFQGISMSGGTFQGLPVIVSQWVPAQLLILVSAEDIYLADDGNVSVDASREASIEMLDSSLTQDATAGTGASLVSMFQTNSVAIRAEREITWLARRTGAAQYLTGFNPGGTAGSGDI